MTPEESIRQVVASVVQHINPLQLILFGSQARGEASRYSDYDLLIIAPSSQPRWKRTVEIYRLLAGSGLPKDIIWWTPGEIAEWKDVKGHFVNNVLREGKVMYERPS